jgi:hypothetical protein
MHAMAMVCSIWSLSQPNRCPKLALMVWRTASAAGCASPLLLTVFSTQRMGNTSGSVGYFCPSSVFVACHSKHESHDGPILVPSADLEIRLQDVNQLPPKQPVIGGNWVVEYLGFYLHQMGNNGPLELEQ